MARTFNITNGSDTVDLIDSSSPGIIATKGGFGQSSFTPHQYYAAQSIEDELFVEHYDLIVMGSSHDNLATQTRALIKLLKQAYLHRKHPEQYNPVYITQQTTNETGTRYAKVYESPEVSNPDFFNLPFETQNWIETQGVNIARGIWRSGAPGTLGSALTLDPTDGPASPTMVHVSNFRDDSNITHLYMKSGSPWGSNLHGTNSWNIFPSVAQNDGLWIGSTAGPFKIFVLPKLSTAGINHSGTLALYYSDGVGTTAALTLGTDYTCYPGPDLEACLEQNDEDIVICVNPPSDWIQDTWNSVNAWWLIISEQAASPSWGTIPVASASQDDYAQRTPEVQIPSTLIEGDTWPYVCIRMYTPAGGDENEGFSSLSRIVIGAKNDPGTFTSHLNAGNQDNPSGWAITYGDDSSSVADVEAPGGYHCAVSFSTEETLVKRAIFTGTDKLGDWIGEYRAFVTCQQVGSGSAGDTGIMLRTYINDASNVYSPKRDTKIVDLEGEDQGHEVVELGTIKIPFGYASSKDSYTSGDIIFEIHAERTTGSGTLEIYSLILIPLDNDYGVTFEDPLTDSVNGSSALRGDNILEDDSGIILNRTIKRVKSGSYIYNSDEWGRGGPSLRLEPLTDTHLYFIMMHYPSGGTWGTGPMIASLGCHLAFELYGQFCYMALRGSG